MRSEKEPKRNGASGMEAPWLHDPPKESVRVDGSPDVEEELRRLEKGVAEEASHGGAAGKEPAKIIVAGGLDEAKAYVAPTMPAVHPEHQTIEVKRVRIAPGADARQAVTQKIDRSLALQIARKGAQESPWAEGAGARIDKALLPSSYAPGSLHAEAPTSEARQPEARPRRGRGTLLGLLVGVAVLAGAIFIASIALQQKGTEQRSAPPSAGTSRSAEPIGSEVIAPAPTAMSSPTSPATAGTSSVRAAEAPAETTSPPPQPAVPTPPSSTTQPLPMSARPVPQAPPTGATSTGAARPSAPKTSTTVKPSGKPNTPPELSE